MRRDAFGSPLTLQRSGGTLDPACEAAEVAGRAPGFWGDECDGRASATGGQTPVTGPSGGPGRGVAGAGRGHLLLSAQKDRPGPGVGRDPGHDLAGAGHPGPARHLEPVHLRVRVDGGDPRPPTVVWPDRKSTRLNSSHVEISYAVF